MSHQKDGQKMTEQKIRAYLEQIRMTQTDLSALTGISSPKISLVLTGKRKLSLLEYEIICGALNVGIGKFIQPRKPNFLGEYEEMKAVTHLFNRRNRVL